MVTSVSSAFPRIVRYPKPTIRQKRLAADMNDEGVTNHIDRHLEIKVGTHLRRGGGLRRGLT